MHFDFQNEALCAIATVAEEQPAWADYAAYCRAREAGQRKDAFRQLETFLRAAAGWADGQRQAFAAFLLPFVETVAGADQGPLPHPLRERLLRPTLAAWCATETADSRPFRWYGKLFRSEAHLQQALAIDPADDQARQLLLGGWIDRLYFATHHLPDSYIGDAKADLQWGESLRAQIDLLRDEALRKQWQSVLEDYLELIRNYREWQLSGHPDLSAWAAAQQKRVDAATATYYIKA